MRSMSRFVPVAVVLLLALILAGCPSRQDTSATEPMPPEVGEGTDVASTEPEPAAGDEAAPVTLTKETVRNFMASMEDEKIEEAMDAIAKELGAEDKDDPEAIKQVLEQAATNADLDEAVKAHGFSGAEEWVQVAQKVMPGLAVATLKVMAEAMGMDEDSQELKDMMAEGDEDLKAFADAFEPPTEEDVQVMVEVLKEQMEEEGNKAE